MNKKLKFGIEMVVNVAILIFLIETLGGMTGILGFLGFTFLMALFILWKRRKDYMRIVDMGVDYLHTVKEVRNNETTNKNKHK